jgi:hypothetical protein
MFCFNNNNKRIWRAIDSNGTVVITENGNPEGYLISSFVIQENLTFMERVKFISNLFHRTFLQLFLFIELYFASKMYGRFGQRFPGGKDHGIHFLFSILLAGFSPNRLQTSKTIAIPAWKIFCCRLIFN